VRCLIDNQLPPALARFLNARGIDAKHVSELGLAEASDAEIWKYATDTGSVLISKDQDFLDFASQSKTTRLIWVSRGNCRTPALLLIFENSWPRIEECLSRGDRFVQIR